MGANQFLLTWNNHKANFATVFSDLRLENQLVDVTLLCDGGRFPAHRLVLAACSPYFASLFSNLDSSHPLIFLRDVRQAELEALLEFIYKGQVSVANSELGGLIKIAESLRIKGLGDVSQRDPTSPPPPLPQHTSSTAHYMRHSSPNNLGGSKFAPNKRSHSPTLTSSCNDGSISNSSPSRPKKVPRRSMNVTCGSNANINSTISELIDESSVKNTAASMYLPDFSALLSAANTYGLAASFPALAAVSAAAAAEYTARQNSAVKDSVTPAAPPSSSCLKSDEGNKLRYCLEKGRSEGNTSTVPCKLKAEKIEEECDEEGGMSNMSASMMEDECSSLNNNNCPSSSLLESTAKTEEQCQQLFQQFYASTSPADVNSLLSTYQQLLSSGNVSSAAVAVAAAAGAAKDSSSTAAASGHVSSCSSSNNSTSSLTIATEEQQQQKQQQSPSPDFTTSCISGTQLIPSTVQDSSRGGVATISSSPVKDAKCLTCNLCGATIKHTANFRRHMKQHLNPRRFPCPWCTAAFGRKDNLKTHTRKHHPNEVEAQEGGTMVQHTMTLNSSSNNNSSSNTAAAMPEQQTTQQANAASTAAAATVTRSSSAKAAAANNRHNGEVNCEEEDYEDEEECGGEEEEDGEEDGTEGAGGGGTEELSLVIDDEGEDNKEEDEEDEEEED